MKVSFLVTYYNQAEFVKKSMESILSVIKPCEWEILAGDDGSGDDTVSIIESYMKLYPDRIKLYVMPREKGKKYDPVMRASANRLNILSHSTGDIFCTLDGDDYYCDTEFINEAVRIFEENEDVSVVSFGYKQVRDGIYCKDRVLPEKTTNHVVDKNIYLKHYYIHAGGCVHRKCFNEDRIDYIKELGHFDDNNIVVNSLNYGNMFAVNRAIYAYRQTGRSIYTSMDELEQAVLNVQGMDVDLKLSAFSLKKTIEQRYSDFVVLMYIWRHELPSILGEEKCSKYKEGCRMLAPSICLDLLTYENISKNRKQEIKEILRMKKRYSFRQWIKYLLRDIVK